MKKRLILFLVLGLIIGAIVHLESKKVHSLGTSNSAPVTVAPTTRDISAKTKKYQLAKELVKPDGYINTGSLPITLSQYIGKKVILLDFWTYSCINCQRTLPYLNDWYAKYKDQGLVIIGMHAPEFDFEKKYDNVAQAVAKFGIKYPVVLDSEHQTWDAYNNQYWPEHYLIDIDGFVVDRTIGEGGYAETEKKIQSLLAERKQVLGETGGIPTAITSIKQVIDANSPETYFGWQRNEYLANGKLLQSGVQQFTKPDTIDSNKLYLDGSWDIQSETATNTTPNAGIIYKYNAKNVYFVADAKTPVTLTILRDGVPVGAQKGADVQADSTVVVNGARLYHLVSEPSASTHTIEIRVKNPGLDAYTFTFG